MRLADQRSQQILRLPRDQTPAVLLMQDGERANVMLFVPPGDTITHLLEGGEPFLPINFATGTRLVARAAIACVTMREVLRIDEDAVIEDQMAVVYARGG